MLSLKRHSRALSRLMAGLFAVQVLAAGFCLIAPQMHSAVASETDMHMNHGMASHCDNDMQANKGHGNHDSACAHCDLPDEMVSKVSTPDLSVTLPVVALIAENPRVIAHPSADLAVRTPTGPPDSSFLLYSTTQRIRI